MGGEGSCAAAPFRAAAVKWAGGCPASHPCCSEYGYCQIRENWQTGVFRDCNGVSNGTPLPPDTIAAEQAAAARGDTRGLPLLGTSPAGQGAAVIASPGGGYAAVAPATGYAAGYAPAGTYAVAAGLGSYAAGGYAAGAGGYAAGAGGAAAGGYGAAVPSAGLSYGGAAAATGYYGAAVSY